MPDGTGGLATGLGAGGALTTAAYLFDKLFGSGRAVKSLDDQFKELKEGLEVELKALLSKVEFTSLLVAKLTDWHDVGDPDDPSGKLWYFSVGLRKCMVSLETKVGRLLSLLEELVRRLDRYNETLEKLITVAERLQNDVSALGVIVAGMDRGRR